MHLKFNSLIRIHDGALDGIYRIVAVPPGDGPVFLYRLKNEVQAMPEHAGAEGDAAPEIEQGEKLFCLPRTVMERLAQECWIAEVDLEVHPKYLLSSDALTERERALYDSRRMAAGQFLDHQLVCDALLSTRGIGKLVTKIRSTHSVSRATCYRLWRLLCRYGFHLSSLNPRFDRCGAPGVYRGWTPERPKVGRKTQREQLGNIESHPQTGVTAGMRQNIVAAYKVLRRDPKLKFDAIYLKTIDICFAEKFQNVDGAINPVAPVQGTYPNKAQVRRIINQETSRLARKLARTTISHFNRNHRGLTGKAWQGIAGPGHVYAIDSTVGDIFLRSRVNRAWSIGRPIVYVVVDVWSTAVVGFHVCLSGPSWATAKVALFSTSSACSSPAAMWGSDAAAQLHPPPTLPHAFLCDRGEYLSKGAQATGELLGVNMQYNPSYRPDLKGLVEVLHRIAKDQQFQFVPGAIDARRKEIDMRADPRDGIFTMDEYVIYLSEIFGQYNFFSDRSYRMNTDMIAAGVDPSPAGLWRHGHEVGVGYQKDESASRLMSTLLPQQNAIVRKDGVYFGGLKYEAPFVQEKNWSANARNFGVMEYSMHYFPGNNSKIWWQDPEDGKLRPLTLASTALAAPGLSFDEWFDARAYERAKKNDREHERIKNALAQLNRTNTLISDARQETQLADLRYEGPVPGMRDAKLLEAEMQTLLPPPVLAEAINIAPKIRDQDDVYDSLMDELFTIESDERGTQ